MGNYEIASQEAAGAAEDTEDLEAGEKFLARLEEIESALNALEYDRKVTFDLENLRIEGLSTVLQEYGSEALFSKLESAASSEKEGPQTLLKFLSELEPDKEARQGLYDKMIADAETAKERHDDREAAGEVLGPYDYGINYVQLVESSVANLRIADNLFHRIRNLGYDDSGVFDGYSNSLLRIGQNDRLVAELRGQFVEHGDNIEQVLETRRGSEKDREEPIRESFQQLKDAIAEYINNLHVESDRVTKERQGALLTDFEKVVDSTDSVATEAAQAALGTAIDKLAQDINQISESASVELREQMAPCIEQLDRIDSSLRHYILRKY